MNDVTRAFVNGNILTMDDSQSQVEAFSVVDGAFHRVGTKEDVLADLNNSAEVVDLEGRTVTPGLIDAHAHLEMTTYALELSVDCRSPEVSSVEEMIRLLQEAARGKQPGEWIFAQGNHFQDAMLRERRYPNRADLDLVSEVHPVVYRPSTHLSVFNTLAMRTINLTRNTPEVPGGSIERDEAGEPTGRVFEMYVAVGGPQAPVEDLMTGIKSVVRRYLAEGVTGVGDIPLLPNGLEAIKELAKADELDMRVSVYPTYPSAVDADLGGRNSFYDELSAINPGMLKGGGIKIFLDGGLTARAAVMYEAYPDDPNYFGILAYEEPELRDLVSRFSSTGRQVLIHAIGDKALDTAIKVLAEATTSSQEAPHRIEHAGNLFMTSDRIRELSTSGVLPVPQPSFVYTTVDGYQDILGKRREWDYFPLKTLLSKGLRLPGNTDAVGIRADQHSPFGAMSAAVTRKTIRGDTVSPHEALGIEDLLRMYTRNSAYAVGREDLGAIEKGKYADFVVFPPNVLQTPDEEVASITVDETWVGGKRVYVRS